MSQFIKRTGRFLLRQYALLGALFYPTKEARAIFREKTDDRIIKLFREDIDQFIHDYPTVWTEEKTIHHIIDNRASICRFGDGEFKLIIGERHKSFQDVNQELNDRMLEVLKSHEPNILIGIHPVRDFDRLGRIWHKFIIRIGPQVLALLDHDRCYPSMGAFRVLPTDNEEAFIARIQLIKQIWQDRKVLLVTGKGSRFTFEEELFNNATSTEFLYAPPKNAFAEYDSILNQILQYDKDEYLIMPVLGPTATVLAHDLAKRGYQAIDFGQMPGTFRKAKKILFGEETFPIPELNI